MFAYETSLYKIVNGKKSRKSNEEIYESDEKLDSMQKLTESILKASRCRVIYAYGAPVQEWLAELLVEQGVPRRMTPLDRCGVLHNVQFYGRTVSIIFLWHPEYIQRWADQSQLERIATVLEVATVVYSPLISYEITYILKKIKKTVSACAQDADDDNLELQARHLMLLPLHSEEVAHLRQSSQNIRTATVEEAERLGQKLHQQVIAARLAERHRAGMAGIALFNIQQEDESDTDYLERQLQVLSTAQEVLPPLPRTSPNYEAWAARHSEITRISAGYVARPGESEASRSERHRVHLRKRSQHNKEKKADMADEELLEHALRKKEAHRVQRGLEAKEGETQEETAARREAYKQSRSEYVSAYKAGAPLQVRRDELPEEYEARSAKSVEAREGQAEKDPHCSNHGIMTEMHRKQGIEKPKQHD